MKKIYIPFDYGYIGGPRTFLDNLQFHLDKYNVAYTIKPDEADSTFFPNVIFDMSTLKKIKANGGKVIQRLNGVTYPSMHGIDYDKKEHTQEIKDIYLNYADFIVFQSEYSKKQCFEMYGVKPDSDYTIIINGVNKEIFKPTQLSIKPGEKVKFATTANFRKKDLIEPIVEALDLLKGKFDFELHLIGDVTNPEMEKYFDRDYVVKHAHENMQGVSKLLQEMHVFIFTNINPPCPNSVVEAISAGLPVVSFDSGSMQDLCPFSKDLLAYVSDDVFQVYEDFKFDKLAEKIELCVNKYDHYKKIAMDNAHLYSFEDCGREYVDVFEKVVGKDIYKRDIISRLKSLFK